MDERDLNTLVARLRDNRARVASRSNQPVTIDHNPSSQVFVSMLL
jgi:hypothetical protein